MNIKNRRFVDVADPAVPSFTMNKSPGKTWAFYN